LERLAEENPELIGRVTRGSEEHKEAYLRLKARLSPQPTQNRRGPGTPGLALLLPALEDANAIQVGLMRIQKALIEDTISTKKAGLLLYSMQLALQNVGQVTLGRLRRSSR
jgi:hypothetical protein